MPVEEQEFEDVGNDEEQRMRDWIECFQIFQEHDELEPHHNVEIKELFSQPEVRDGDELIFYYPGYGSFSMQYSPELYQDRIITRGSLEVNPMLLDLVFGTSDMEPETLLEKLGNHVSEEPGRSYLQPVNELDPEIGVIMELEVPRDYDRMKVIDAVYDGVDALDLFREYLSALG